MKHRYNIIDKFNSIKINSDQQLKQMQCCEAQSTFKQSYVLASLHVPNHMITDHRSACTAKYRRLCTFSSD